MSNEIIKIESEEDVVETVLSVIPQMMFNVFKYFKSEITWHELDPDEVYEDGDDDFEDDLSNEGGHIVEYINEDIEFIYNGKEYTCGEILDYTIHQDVDALRVWDNRPPCENFDDVFTLTLSEWVDILETTGFNTDSIRKYLNS